MRLTQCSRLSYHVVNNPKLRRPIPPSLWWRRSSRPWTASRHSCGPTARPDWKRGSCPRIRWNPWVPRLCVQRESRSSCCCCLVFMMKSQRHEGRGTNVMWFQTFFQSWALRYLKTADTRYSWSCCTVPSSTFRRRRGRRRNCRLVPPGPSWPSSGASRWWTGSNRRSAKPERIGLLPKHPLLRRLNQAYC